MIRDWEEHNLHMDFSNINTSPGKPSDVDMWYISKANFLIIGEIKNAKGTFTQGQKYLLTRLIDNHKGGGAILYITHNKDVHKGDKFVDVSKCQVTEYYWQGKWRTPRKPTTVNEAFKVLTEGVF